MTIISFFKSFLLFPPSRSHISAFLGTSSPFVLCDTEVPARPARFRGVQATAVSASLRRGRASSLARVATTTLAGPGQPRRRSWARGRGGVSCTPTALAPSLASRPRLCSMVARPGLTHRRRAPATSCLLARCVQRCPCSAVNAQQRLPSGQYLSLHMVGPTKWWVN